MTKKLSICDPLYAICIPNDGVVVSHYGEFAVSKMDACNDYMWDAFKDMEVGAYYACSTCSESTREDLIHPNLLVMRLR